LGHEESLDEKKRSLIPRKIVNIEKIIKISTGNKHNLALSVNKKVYSWGDNSFGQLGI
jgi:alpha-tubulin suppressor-like RCC1 family protein